MAKVAIGSASLDVITLVKFEYSHIALNVFRRAEYLAGKALKMAYICGCIKNGHHSVYMQNGHGLIMP